MDIKLNILSLSLAVLAMTSSVCAAEEHPVSSIKEPIQKIANDYYKQYSKTEQFTAMAVSVLVPHNRKIDANDITNVVIGTMGFPPLTQAITPDNLFDIGSITKSFTAFILLQLQTENKLSLEDSLGKWLPQYPQWKDVTLRQLLNMTSGIPNYSEDPVFDKKMMSDLARVWTNEELLTYAHPEKPLKHNRTNRYEYCNSNYILAALVIEKVTNDRFENQLKQRILTQNNYFQNTFYPAGLDGVAVEKAIKSRRVNGYFYDEAKRKRIDTINNDLSWAGAAGALVANTEDVIHWVQVLYHGVLINPVFKERALAELESIVSVKTGLPIASVSKEDPMGFGLGVASHYDDELKQSFWTYEGSTLGFRVMYLWTACNDVTTVVALNSKGGEGNKKSEIGDHIAEVSVTLYKAVLQHYPELRCEA